MSLDFVGTVCLLAAFLVLPNLAGQVLARSGRLVLYGPNHLFAAVVSFLACVLLAGSVRVLSGKVFCSLAERNFDDSFLSSCFRSCPRKHLLLLEGVNHLYGGKTSPFLVG